MTTRYRIRSAALNGYVEVAVSVGLDPRAMLSAVGLSHRVLFDPDVLIPAERVGRLLERSALVAGVDDFGLRMAESRRLSNLGPLGLVASHAPTLRAMLAAIVRYLRLHNESLVLRIAEADGIVLLSQTLSTGAPQARIRQAIELAVGALHRIVGSILGDAWHPLRVCFMHGPPRDTCTHRRVFGATTRLEFDAAIDGLVCRASDLDRPIPAADPALARYARLYIDELVRSAGSAGSSAQVRHLVFTLLPTGRCTADRVAEALGVDRRTVHRHLARDGTTFSRVLTDVRRELAERYVGQRARPLSDAAELLGFSTQSAFAGWFRSHYGCSASTWRAAGGAAPSAHAILAATTPRRRRPCTPGTP